MEFRNPFSLSGKTALVVGASRGIGLAITNGVAAAGAHTILAARSEGPLQEATNSMKNAGLTAEYRLVDVASRESVAALSASLPDLDILINVSGTNIRKQFESYTPEEYERLMNTNLRGLYELTQKVGARMVQRGAGGKIVNIGSLTSLLGFPYLSIYAMTKSALAGMTRALAAEWGRYNIQVNLIAPGFILTDLNRQMWEDQTMIDWLKGGQANPRMGAPEDISPLAVFLSGPGSDYITGQIIAVDGGFTTCSVWPFEPRS